MKRNPLFAPASEAPPRHRMRRIPQRRPSGMTYCTRRNKPRTPQRILALALVLLAGIMAGSVAPQETLADEVPAQQVQITVAVEGFEGTLPTLVSGIDFTVGEPVKSDPRFMTDDTGHQPLAALVETRESQGYALVWRDQDGNAFDWFATPVNADMAVYGSFEEATYEVRVSVGENEADDLVVAVKRGQSFVEAHGSAPATPTKQGCTFERWVDAADESTFDFSAPVTASTTVYAAFSITERDQVVTVDPGSDVPKSLTGRCYIGATWSVHPAKFSLSRFTGGLQGCSGTGSCSLPSAAAPSYTWADYKATLASVDVAAGKVVYNVTITPPGAAHPGGPRNSLGLIGYQTVSFQAVVQKNFGGYLEVTKNSSQTQISDNNATYSLKGAVFAVYNKAGACVARLTTDENGKTERSPLLPAGTYTVKEETAPKGYATAAEQTATIASGKTTQVKVADAPQYSLIKALVHKVDKETEQQAPLGSASLEGARFKVSYYDRHLTASRGVAALIGALPFGLAAQAPSADEITSWGTPKRTWIFETDSTGAIAFDAEHLAEGDDFYRNAQGEPVLPLGTVVVQEIAAPKGYLIDSTPVVRDVVSTGTEPVVGTWLEASRPEQVKRGDFSFTKVASPSMERLAGVPFRITSATTGEAHVLVTDENGMASTTAAWAPHTHNTNAGTSADDGIWFGIDADGTTAPPNDSLGALPYDTYTVEELPCSANEGLEMVTFSVTISRNKVALDLGTIDDKEPDLDISGEIDKRETLINADGAFAYTIDYRSTTDIWVDEFNMVDEIACAAEDKAHLVSIRTPVCFEDYDGLMNVWYRTNLDDEKKAATEDENGNGEDGQSADQDTGKDASGNKADAASGSETESASAAPDQEQSAPNACATNPANPKNPNNERVRDYSAWHLWKAEVSTLASEELAVADLDLEDGEHVVAVAFEHGRVEANFATNAPDAEQWQRRDRYTERDLTDSTDAHEATFDLAQAAGPTNTEEPTEVAFAPAVFMMQATQESLDNGAEELWNDAAIDLHRDLKLHDEDDDSVVQSISPTETVVKKTVDEVVSHLPKTDDPAGIGMAAALLAALAGGAALIALTARNALRRRRLRSSFKGWR